MFCVGDWGAGPPAPSLATPMLSDRSMKSSTECQSHLRDFLTAAISRSTLRKVWAEGACKSSASSYKLQKKSNLEDMKPSPDHSISVLAIAVYYPAQVWSRFNNERTWIATYNNSALQQIL